MDVSLLNKLEIGNWKSKIQNPKSKVILLVVVKSRNLKSREIQMESMKYIYTMDGMVIWIWYTGYVYIPVWVVYSIRLKQGKRYRWARILFGLGLDACEVA